MSVEVAGLITSADSYNYGLSDFSVMGGMASHFLYNSHQVHLTNHHVGVMQQACTYKFEK